MFSFVSSLTRSVLPAFFSKEQSGCTRPDRARLREQARGRKAGGWVSTVVLPGQQPWEDRVPAPRAPGTAVAETADPRSEEYDAGSARRELGLLGPVTLSPIPVS